MGDETYAEIWADAINDTYGDVDGNSLLDDDVDGESYEDAEKRILTKAARILRGYDESATFTGAELDLVRHLMPAHEVHQSYAMRSITDRYGPPLNPAT